MKAIFLSIFALYLITIVLGEKTFLDTGLIIRLLRITKMVARKLLGTNEAEYRNHLREARNLGRIQNLIPDNVPFPCNVSEGRSKSVPTSVHKLRPGDIDVIAAMGDSLIAGAGAFGTNILHIWIENRGVSAIGGGQGTWRDSLTIPNIIKEFNPNLVGYSPYDSLTHEEASELNVAELAAMSRDLPFMAKNLVHRMKNHPKVDMKNHWKLISILIGSNDFCNDMCWRPSGARSVLKNHKAELLEALRILKKNLPRTLISFIPPPNLKHFASLKKSSFCDIFTVFECTCLAGAHRQSQMNEFTKIMSRWQKIDEEVASYPEFQTEDFAVVFQPFIINLKIPTKLNGATDWRYLSPDCFHLSQVAHARAALAIWRNMLEPVGEKTRDWDDINTFKCPTESQPYIMTAANSHQASNNIN